MSLFEGRYQPEVKFCYNLPRLFGANLNLHFFAAHSMLLCNSSGISTNYRLHAPDTTTWLTTFFVGALGSDRVVPAV